MSIHHSIKPGILYEQPGTKITCDNEGKWTAVVNYLCAATSFTKMCPRVGGKYPSIPFITLGSVESTFIEGDLAEITCNYAGVDPLTDPGSEEEQSPDPNGGDPPKKENANATYSMGLAVGEEPLLTHLRYRNLPADELKALHAISSGKDKDDNKIDLTAKVKSVRGLEALAKIKRGQTSYYSPKITWRESFVSNKPVTAESLNRIGKINIPNGPCPAMGQRRDWIRNGVTQTQEGKVFRIEIEWLCSNPDGWDPDIYA